MLRLVANREEEDVRSKSKERDNIVCLGEFNIIEQDKVMQGGNIMKAKRNHVPNMGKQMSIRRIAFLIYRRSRDMYKIGGEKGRRFKKLKEIQIELMARDRDLLPMKIRLQESRIKRGKSSQLPLPLEVKTRLDDDIIFSIIKARNIRFQEL